jgi:hypothetical protein
MATRVSRAVLLLGAVSGLPLLGAGPVHSQGLSYGWSISAGATEAYDNHIEFPGARVFSFYLWLVCAPTGSAGMSVAEFGLASSGGGNLILEFIPQNGFLNTGSATNLLLTVGLCPSGPVMAGEIRVLITEPGNLCLTTSEGGVLATEDCVIPPPLPDTWRGLDFGGEFCFQGAMCDFFDAPIPCCFPDGSCEEISALEWEQYCLGNGGYAPPVQFCSDWNCAPVAVGSEPPVPQPWGRVKARYRVR